MKFREDLIIALFTRLVFLNSPNGIILSESDYDYISQSKIIPAVLDELKWIS